MCKTGNPHIPGTCPPGVELIETRKEFEPGDRTEAESKTIADFLFVTMMQSSDNLVFSPPARIPCMRCGGKLEATGFNTQKTLIFLDCRGRCKHCYVIPVDPKEFFDGT